MYDAGIRKADECVGRLLDGIAAKGLADSTLFVLLSDHGEEMMEHGSLANYLWHFVGGKPIQNRWSSLSRAPPATDESKAMSRDLLRRGFKFVGPTICRKPSCRRSGW